MARSLVDHLQGHRRLAQIGTKFRNCHSLPGEQKLVSGTEFDTCRAQDGKATSATIVAAYLIYCGLFSSSEAALRFFADRRFPNGYRGIVRPSQRRRVVKRR